MIIRLTLKLDNEEQVKYKQLKEILGTKRNSDTFRKLINSVVLTQEK